MLGYAYKGGEGTGTSGVRKAPAIYLTCLFALKKEQHLEIQMLP
jgi:hypothetical protein